MRRSSKNPESLARGVGLGLFIGFLPVVGFQVILALLMASLFNANRLVTILGTLVTNPFTAIPVGALSLWLGERILPGTNLAEISMGNFDVSKILESSGTLGVTYLVGCLSLSIFFGFLGYGVFKVYFLYKESK